MKITDIYIYKNGEKIIKKAGDKRRHPFYLQNISNLRIYFGLINLW